MSIDRQDVYPNARVNHDGQEVTITDVNANTVSYQDDTGQVKTYASDYFYDQASVWEPPQEAAPADTNATATTIPVTELGPTADKPGPTVEPGPTPDTVTVDGVVFTRQQTP